jgi:hypothetical protein
VLFLYNTKQKTPNFLGLGFCCGKLLNLNFYKTPSLLSNNAGRELIQPHTVDCSVYSPCLNECNIGLYKNLNVCSIYPHCTSNLNKLQTKFISTLFIVNITPRITNNTAITNHVVKYFMCVAMSPQFNLWSI